MASQWRQVQHNLQQEKIDISRFLAEDEHEFEDHKHPHAHDDGVPRVQISVKLDEETLAVLKQDAAFQGMSAQDLVRWLLNQYADGQLTPKHYPLI